MWLETLEAVREAAGDDCAVAVRIGVDLTPGFDVDEALEFVRLADHLVDLWDVNVGSIAEWSHDSGSSRFFPEGYQLEWTGRVREATAKPIVGVSRLTNPDRMAEIVSSGAWDLIGAARPSIADPFLPAKIEQGRYGEVRECTGSNVCIAKADTLMHLGCLQNATAGEEFRRGWHPERFEPAANRDRDVLVVGAGPAGMECAIVLAKRGFRRVHLVEAEREIGGHMRWLPRLPGIGEWARVVNWRRVQLDRLGNVEVLTGVRLSAGDARRYGAELVILATGSRWADDGLNALTHDPIPGADAALAHVLTPEQIMVDGKRPAGRRVCVYDTEGYQVAAALAEQLASEGLSVELVTPFDVVAPGLRRDARGPAAAAPDPRRGRLRAPQRDRHRGRAGPDRRRGRVRRGPRARGGRHRPRHPAGFRRRALPRAHGRRGGAPSRGCRGRLPRRRLRQPEARRRGRLRRPSPRPRDRLGEPRGAAPAPPRAALTCPRGRGSSRVRAPRERRAQPTGSGSRLEARACVALTASQSSMRCSGSSGWRPVCSRSRSMR